MPNVFEELLTKIDQADRESLSAIVSRNPQVSSYLAEPEAVQRYEATKTWYAANWDKEHNCTREEWNRHLRIESLEADLAARPQGEEMNFDELNKFLDDKIAKGEVVSSKLMKDEFGNLVAVKDAEFNTRINSLAAASMDAMYLVGRHMKDHNEALDTLDLINKATEAKAGNLRDFYENSYAKDKIEAKRAAATAEAQAKHDAEIAAAREEGRKAALQERVGQEHGMPIVEGSPDLGHFQARMMKPAVDKEGNAVAPNLEIGRGQIARLAAAAADRAEAAGNHAA